MEKLCGSLVVIGVVFVLAKLFAGEISLYLSVFVSAALVVTGVKMWSEPGMPNSHKDWAWTLLGAPVFGGLVFCVEMVIGKLAYPELGPIEAGLHTGPFGGVLTVICTAAMMVVSMGGIAHGFAEQFIRKRRGSEA
ncbi:hypothetical protein [Polaromonas sp. JS666]|uniref:hypothetical protein n=1 Tax=Polaromonas sp. (strain JS666 / ATCC BAA-500) TaxID=296591 RepID=UPI000943F035|nr:hypothetical protein [Polaromonas sp. JS666]